MTTAELGVSQLKLAATLLTLPQARLLNLQMRIDFVIQDVAMSDHRWSTAVRPYLANEGDRHNAQHEIQEAIIELQRFADALKKLTP